MADAVNMQLLWDLNTELANLSIEIKELKQLTSKSLLECPSLNRCGILDYGTPHFNEWFEQAKQQMCRVDDLEEFGECDCCLHAYQHVQKRKKLQLQRGYVRTKITKLVMRTNKELST